MKRVLKVGLVATILLIQAGCTDGNNTKRVLEDQGFTDVQLTGYRYWACGDDYNFHTGFKAKAPNTHKEVTGTVCSGFMKGNSIKFD